MNGVWAANTQGWQSVRTKGSGQTWGRWEGSLGELWAFPGTTLCTFLGLGGVSLFPCAPVPVAL